MIVVYAAAAIFTFAIVAICALATWGLCLLARAEQKDQS